MTAMVQTVTGAIPASELGRTLMHEHLFIAFAGAELDPNFVYDRPAVVAEAVRRLVELREVHGVKSFVEAAPIELGRDGPLLKEMSEKSGVHIICATGFYFDAMGVPGYWRIRSAEEIAAAYIRELTHGIGNTGIRPGFIKVATGAPVITEMEKRIVAAACIAQKATGVPLITHTQDGFGGPEQQELFAAGGVEARMCLIGHCCGNPHPAYHRRVVDGGSYIGFDRIGIVRLQPDEVRADNLAKLVRDGYAGQVMMSQDRHAARLGKLQMVMTPADEAHIASLKAAGKWPPPYTHLFTNFLPMLRARGVTEADIATMLDDNPRRFFAGDPLPAVAPKTGAKAA
jgi:phosphotriesterase-related protein